MPPAVAVIEYDPDIRTLLDDILQAEGYMPRLYARAQGVEQALHDAPPAAIILDVILEQPFDGWDLLLRLHNDALLRSIPVIVCTADVRALAAFRPRLAALGCTCITKPFRLDALLDALHCAVDWWPGRVRALA
jgi:DNA-binding response OmpR family regulator